MTTANWNFKDWYDKNSKSFNKDRRSRYETDPEYRARVLETNRASRLKRREQVKTERAAETAAIKVKPAHKPWKEIAVATTDGSEATKLYSIGALARALGRSVQAVRLWEKKGVIPETTLRNEKGDRLYTPDDVARLHALLEAKGRLDDKPAVPDRLLIAHIRLTDGTEIETPVFRVGKFAQAIGRSVVTLEQMERRGVIPESPLRTIPKPKKPKITKITKGKKGKKKKRLQGHRVYTGEMIEVVKNALDKRGPEIRGDDAWAEFAAEVADGWKAAKMDKAQLLDVRTEASGGTDIQAADGDETDDDPSYEEDGR